MVSQPKEKREAPKKSYETGARAGKETLSGMIFDADILVMSKRGGTWMEEIMLESILFGNKITMTCLLTMFPKFIYFRTKKQILDREARTFLALFLK